jgi:hypothetical protein
VAVVAAAFIVTIDLSIIVVVDVVFALWAGVDLTILGVSFTTIEDVFWFADQVGYQITSPGVGKDILTAAEAFWAGEVLAEPGAAGVTTFFGER